MEPAHAFDTGTAQVALRSAGGFSDRLLSPVTCSRSWATHPWLRRPPGWPSTTVLPVRRDAEGVDRGQLQIGMARPFGHHPRHQHPFFPESGDRPVGIGDHRHFPRTGSSSSESCRKPSAAFWSNVGNALAQPSAASHHHLAGPCPGPVQYRCRTPRASRRRRPTGQHLCVTEFRAVRHPAGEQAGAAAPESGVAMPTPLVVGSGA